MFATWYLIVGIFISYSWYCEQQQSNQKKIDIFRICSLCHRGDQVGSIASIILRRYYVSKILNNNNKNTNTINSNSSNHSSNDNSNSNNNNNINTVSVNTEVSKNNTVDPRAVTFYFLFFLFFFNILVCLLKKKINTFCATTKNKHIIIIIIMTIGMCCMCNNWCKKFKSQN